MGEAGEQHCVVRDEGDGHVSVTLVEVAEAQRPTRFVLRYPTYPTTVVASFELEPDATGVTLTYQVGWVVEWWQRKKMEQALRAQTQSQLDQIAALIRSGVRLPDE